MAVVAETRERPLASRRRRGRRCLHDWVTSVDHKKIGVMYIILALIFLVIGGIEALLMRWQLFRPRNDFLGPDFFNQMFTMHGTTMVFFMGMPILIGFGNYLVPLMIGARDMAFPRLNALGFWLTLFGGLLVLFQLRDRRRPGHRLVCLFAADRAHFRPLRGHRLLGFGPAWSAASERSPRG